MVSMTIEVEECLCLFARDGNKAVQRADEVIARMGGVVCF